MKKVNWFCLIIAGIMALSMLAGCSGNNNAPAASSAAQASESAAAPAESAAASESAAAPTEEAPAERTQLTVEVFDRANQNGTDPTNNYWTDWMKKEVAEKLNIDLTFLSVPRSEEVAQLNVLMAGGSPPDIVFTYTQSLAYGYYKQGGLADLTDIVEAHGPTIKSYLGGEVLETGKFDGRLYMIPAKRISRATYNTFMRKDWLDKLGLAVPQTMDDFYNALVAFKEQNPGGVDNVIPYSMHQKAFNFNCGNILDAFTEISGMSDKDKFVLGVAQDANSTNMLYPGFKEGIRFMNKMYNERLLDQEFALHAQYSDVETLIMRGQVGSWTSNYDSPIRTSPGVYNQLKENVPGAEIIVLDCFVNTGDGSHMRQEYAANGIYNFVPAASKNVEGAVKYLDWLCQDDVRTYLVIGDEGVNHTKDEEGIPVMINLQNDPRMMNSPNNLDYAMIVNGVDLSDMDKNLKAIAKSYEEQYVDWFMEAYETAMRDAVVFVETVVPFDSEGQYGTSLNEKRYEVLAAAVTASEADFDAVYDAGIQEWKDTGGQVCLDEREAYWDSTH